MSSIYIPYKKHQRAMDHIHSGGGLNQISAFFHKSNVLQIKEDLGSNCTFVAHKRNESTGEYFLIAKFKVDGKQKEIKAKLNGTPSDIKKEGYTKVRKEFLENAKSRGFL